MITKFKILALIGLSALSVIAQAQGAAWTANAQDKTLSALVERWAQSEGRHAKWEAAADFPIVDAEGLNHAAKLSNASSMTNAVERLLNQLSTVASRKDGTPGPKDIGYFACSFATGNVAVVIRSLGQPDCSKSLQDQRVVIKDTTHSGSAGVVLTRLGQSCTLTEYKSQKENPNAMAVPVVENSQFPCDAQGRLNVAQSNRREWMDGLEVKLTKLLKSD